MMQTNSGIQVESWAKPCKKWWLFVGLVGVVLMLDQATKQAVHNSFGLYESRPVIESFLHLTYVRNSGAAFGMFAQRDPIFLRIFFITVTSLALVILLVYYSRVPLTRPFTLWGLGFIAAGALGNGIDRLWIGQVIDFIDIHAYGYHWPAFNVADSAICVGVGGLLLDTFRLPTT